MLARMSQSATARGQWVPRSRRPAATAAVAVGPPGSARQNLNAVFGRFRRRMLAAELPTGAVERRDIDNASKSARRTMPATLPDLPLRLPVRALGEYVPGGRVDAMRRLLGGR